MEGESNGMEGGQTQCRAGCGFFGSPATDGLCSVCYKEMVKKKQQPPSGSLKVSSPQRITPSVENRASPSRSIFSKPTEEDASKSEKINEAGPSPPDVKSTSDSEPSSSNENPSGSDGKKKSNRCQICRKKVGLTGFQCRCGGLYCSIHRYSDKHNCTFDYRQLGAEEIRKNNPVVVGEKIHKI